jgi:putative ABC transport system substrate-binding protein
MIPKSKIYVIFDSVFGKKQTHDRTWMCSSSFSSDNRKSKIQNRKWAGLSVIVFFVLAGALAQAQRQKKTARIGFLAINSASSTTAHAEAFRQGLRQVGYVEGQNIIVEWRYADGKSDRLPGLAAELLGLKVDVIVTGATAPTRALKQATNTIPIVIATHNDPVGAGLVASLAHPGGNVTGLSNIQIELSGKRLELLKEIVPKLSRVAILRIPSVPATPPQMKEMELAAHSLGIKLQSADWETLEDLENTFSTMMKRQPDALITFSGPRFGLYRTRIIELAAENRLPTMYPDTIYADGGGLVSYGVNTADLYRRAAVYVDKILKGAKPAELPVEQPTKFELVINLKTANKIDLRIPPNMLARADKVIR